ncbi:MAG: hypothetical protein AB7N91_27765 [Candidatus Tectimicrobiota bacterium]
MSERPSHATPVSSQETAQDILLRPILVFTLTLIAVLGLVLLGMSWLFSSATARQVRRDTPPAPMAQTASPLPPEPRLQVKPVQDLQQLRSEEEALLQSYGWIDQSTGTVRIPIARAMELLSARGLPSRPALSESPGPAPKETP